MIRTEIQWGKCHGEHVTAALQLHKILWFLQHRHSCQEISETARESSSEPSPAPAKTMASVHIQPGIWILSPTPKSIDKFTNRFLFSLGNTNFYKERCLKQVHTASGIIKFPEDLHFVSKLRHYKILSLSQAQQV